MTKPMAEKCLLNELVRMSKRRGAWRGADSRLSLCSFVSPDDSQAAGGDLAGGVCEQSYWNPGGSAAASRPWTILSPERSEHETYTLTRKPVYSGEKQGNHCLTWRLGMGGRLWASRVALVVKNPPASGGDT